MSLPAPKAPSTILREIRDRKQLYAITLDIVNPWNFLRFDPTRYGFLYPFCFSVENKMDAYSASHVIKLHIDKKLQELGREIHFERGIVSTSYLGPKTSPIKNVRWREEPTSFRESLYGTETVFRLIGDYGYLAFLKVQDKKSSYYHNPGSEIGEFTLNEVLEAWPLDGEDLNKVMSLDVW